VLVAARVPAKIAQEVDRAALPGRPEDLGQRRFEPGMRVADRQLNADQAARDKAAQELGQNASVSAAPMSRPMISRRPVS
jgi:hypothetical protein